MLLKKSSRILIGDDVHNGRILDWSHGKGEYEIVVTQRSFIGMKARCNRRIRSTWLSECEVSRYVLR